MHTPQHIGAPQKTSNLNDTSSSKKLVLSWLPGQPNPQNMPDVLGEHQFMLENFETIYTSTNRTVPFMSQSFIAGSAILCHFMPNDRSLWGSSLISSIPPQKLLCRLKISPLHTSQSSYELFLYWNISIKASYPKWTHFIIVARVSMFLRDDRILQNFCWMPEAKWRVSASWNLNYDGCL